MVYGQQEKHIYNIIIAGRCHGEPARTLDLKPARNLFGGGVRALCRVRGRLQPPSTDGLGVSGSWVAAQTRGCRFRHVSKLVSLEIGAVTVVSVVTQRSRERRHRRSLRRPHGKSAALEGRRSRPWRAPVHHRRHFVRAPRLAPHHLRALSRTITMPYSDGSPHQAAR